MRNATLTPVPVKFVNIMGVGPTFVPIPMPENTQTYARSWLDFGRRFSNRMNGGDDAAPQYYVPNGGELENNVMIPAVQGSHNRTEHLNTGFVGTSRFKGGVSCLFGAGAPAGASVVLLVLQWCFWCFTGASLVLHWCFWRFWCFSGLVLDWCLTGSLVFHWCLTGA